jgi:predicted HTH transcriptional regulator
MANKGKGSIGYVIAGVADKKEDAEELHAQDSTIEIIEKNGFSIVGLEYDMKKQSISQDRYYQKLIQIIDKEPINEKYKAYIGQNVRLINYANKAVLILKIMGLDSPSIYDNNFYKRMGANIEKVEPKDMGNLFDRFKN